MLHAIALGHLEAVLELYLIIRLMVSLGISPVWQYFHFFSLIASAIPSHFEASMTCLGLACFTTLGLAVLA